MHVRVCFNEEMIVRNPITCSLQEVAQSGDKSRPKHIPLPSTRLQAIKALNWNFSVPYFLDFIHHPLPRRMCKRELKACPALRCLPLRKACPRGRCFLHEVEILTFVSRFISKRQARARKSLSSFPSIFCWNGLWGNVRRQMSPGSVAAADRLSWSRNPREARSIISGN